MDGMVVAIVAAVWLIVAVGVAIVITRMATRGEQAAEMATLTREVSRADSAPTAPAPVRPSAVPARAPWNKTTER